LLSRCLMKMFKKEVFLVVLFLSLILLPSAFGLSLSGAKLGTVIYEPGKVIRNSYTITDTSLPVDISVSAAGLSDFIRIEKQDRYHFDLVLEFPDLLVEEGTYIVGISAQEIAPEGAAGINSLLSVSKMFQVEVYSREKNIGVSFNAPQTNEQEPIKFELDVQSRTYQDIDSIAAEITIYDSYDQEVGRIATAEKPLKALSTERLSASYDSKDMPPANYWAQAKVRYDGQVKILNDSFKIGTMDIALINHTSILNRGFSEFIVLVENSWGNEIPGVYAKLFIDGTEVLQTPSIDLSPWSTGELKGIVKLDIPPGTYPSIIKIFLSGEEKEFPVFLTVTDEVLPEIQEARAEVSQKNQVIIILSSILIVILIIGIIIFWKGRSRNDYGG